ncbi:MAG: hypothetical protein ABIH28_03310 [archaeon]
MEEQFILFDEQSKETLLEIMKKSVDSEGFIVEKDNPTERVLTKDGEEIKLEEFAGVRKGSEIFIKNDINSILELAETFE